MGFKEAGEFIQANVPNSVKDGGVYFDKKGYAEFSVNHSNFRLRVQGQENTEKKVSVQDIKPIKIQPGPVVPKATPQVLEISCGLEAEFEVLDQDGNPADLYNGNKVYMNGKGVPEIEYYDEKEDWLIDKINVSPEGLRFQAEIDTTPATSWHELEKNTLVRLRDTYLKCRQNNLLLLPTGLGGGLLEADWNNISTIPYILKIHSYGLNGTALDFDSNTVQSHVDLTKLGSSDFAIYAANVYNNLLATMYQAVSTSAPFWKGRITNNKSNREFARNRLSTVGGVQADIPVDGHALIQKGDRLVREGKIPVPERAAGSHNDLRPAKYTTGTFEAGSPDMNPNLDFWLAHAFINRQFLLKISEHLKTGEPLPPFMEKTTFETRKQNRRNTSHLGSKTDLKINGGSVGVEQAWEHFFDWARPKDDPDQSWEKSKETIRIMLAPTKACIYGQQSMEAYFDHTNPSTYMRGNFSEVMRTYADSLPPMRDTEKIRLTNQEISSRFMNYLHLCLVGANLL